MATVPLLRALTESGIGSRRHMADAIRRGVVEVNGRVAEDFKQPVNVGTDCVTVNGNVVDLKRQELVYLVLNKPKGVLSTTSDERGRRTVISILPEKYRHLGLYPVGRLDKDSTGLMLLTNDGQLTYRLTHPRFEHEKEYLVHMEGSLRPSEKRKIEQGLELDDGTTSPAIVEEKKSVPPYNYSIVVHEGRKRQVRRMFGVLGHRVIALKRIRMGSLSIGDLEEGEVRELSAQEVGALLCEITRDV